MQKPIAITGATGFIGQRVARRLTASGWRLRALIRPATTGREPRDLDVKWLVGELHDPGVLERLITGVSAVIHCAGAVRGKSASDFDLVNVEATTQLARIAAGLPQPPRFLLLSSLAARAPQLSFYAASKRHGEEALMACDGAMFRGILRPPAVYGPGDKEMRPLFQWMLQRGVAPLIGPDSNRVSLIHVEDLARAIESWLTGCHQDRQIFELHDGKTGGYSWQEIIEVVAELRQRPVRRVSIPVSFLTRLAALNQKMAGIFGFQPMLTPGKVRELIHPDWVADNRQLAEATGWQPQVDLAAGLTSTFALPR
ncbi:MAG: NAD-dependent epimerase/dehydratase family protein [Desulfopila sp.]